MVGTRSKSSLPRVEVAKNASCFAEDIHNMNDCTYRSQALVSERSPQLADPVLLNRLAADMLASIDNACCHQINDENGIMTEENQLSHTKSENLCWRPELCLPSSPILENIRPSHATPLTKLSRVPPPNEREATKKLLKYAPPLGTAGKQWFELPETAVTEEVKRDLRTLRLRSAFDPKIFYKKFDSTKFPKYFHFGTVIEGPTEFYSGRLTKGKRRCSLTDEILADSHIAQSRKNRYAKLQEEKGLWSKKQGRKTTNARMQTKSRKARH